MSIFPSMIETRASSSLPRRILAALLVGLLLLALALSCSSLDGAVSLSFGLCVLLLILPATRAPEPQAALAFAPRASSRSPPSC